MLTLLTSNPGKYAPFARELARMDIGLEQPKGELLELQTLSFPEALAAKARAAAQLYGRPVLVDDAGLVLEAYRGFPGPLTSTVLRSLGVEALKRLLDGGPPRGRMECHIGCWLEPTGLKTWSGRVEGHLDFSRPPRNDRLILSDIFVPKEQSCGGELLHRARALAALEADILDLHLDTTPRPAASVSACARPQYDCAFCAEFENEGLSIFASMMGEQLSSRVVYEDEHFVIMPPLGEFVEGGLLLLTREHILSFAHLRLELFESLQRLLKAVCLAVTARWGVSPLVFEHGPALEWSKGVCCVEHAHLNIFPARMELHPHLNSRMHRRVGSLSELPRLARAQHGYLFVQENDGTQRAYDGRDVPTQLVRRLITSALGMPERWHWRDYPGKQELLATYHALKGQIRV